VVGLVVKNLNLSSRAVVQFYNKRGTAKQWIKEGKHAAAHWTQSCCYRFPASEMRLQLSVLVQPGQLVATAGASKEHSHLVTDELTAAVSEKVGGW
jgi:hypothetical protein